MAQTSLRHVRRSLGEGGTWKGLATLAGGAALLYLVLFWRLGVNSFWDPDEAHYAETTREMLVSGDWLAPFYNQQPFFDKPIVFHWLQGSAMAIGGLTEGAARFAPALGGLVLVLITAWVGAQLAGAGVGLVAGLLLACNPGLFGLARYAILDAPFTACLFGGAACLTVAAVQRRRGLEYGGYACLAAATCIKGPLALALTGLTFLLALAISPEARRALLPLHWVRGLAFAIVLGALWPLYMWLRFEDLFVQGYFLNENLRLFAEPLYANQPPWWFYLQILIVGFLPWTGLILGRAYDRVRGGAPADLFEVLLWCWTIAIVGFFSFSQFKLDHYVFPAAPALCLLAARAWSDAWQGTPGARGARLGAQSVGPLIVIAGIAVGVLALDRLDLPRTFLIIPAVLIVLGIGATLQGIRLPPSLRRTDATDVPDVLHAIRLKPDATEVPDVLHAIRLKPDATGVPDATEVPDATGVPDDVPVASGFSRITLNRSVQPPVLALCAMAVLYIGVIAWVLPKLESGKVIPDIARWVAANATPDTRLITFQLNRWNPAFRFYVDRPVTIVDHDAEIKRLFGEPAAFYCITTLSRLPALELTGFPVQVVYQRDGLWASSGQALWRRKGEPTTFIVAALKK